MKKFLPYVMALLLTTVLLSGCGNAPATVIATDILDPEEPDAAATSTAVSLEGSATPDPCVSPQLEVEIQELHRHMREFDDASLLASNIPREQLGDSIAELQRIRREAEDEEIPACLTNLKMVQVQHMNTVIATLIAFMGGTEQETLDQGIALARQQHDLYTLELARLLGLTVVPASTPTPTP